MEKPLILGTSPKALTLFGKTDAAKAVSELINDGRAALNRRKETTGATTSRGAQQTAANRQRLQTALASTTAKPKTSAANKSKLHQLICK